MSTLTQEEITAGVSRRALATMHRRQDKTTTPQAPAPKPNGQDKPETRERTISEIMSGFVCHRVIDTPMRQVDVLESVHGWVILRETSFTPEMRAAATSIVFEYAEVHALAATLAKLEPRDQITGATKRGRA